MESPIMTSPELQKTPLHQWHADAGARLVDFAGFDMPVQYTGITEEHNAVRSIAGLFDISHMGRLWFTGPDACKFLDHIVTNDVTMLSVGQIRYALVTNEQGGILDDVLVYRWDDAYALVVNASNRPKIANWIDQHIDGFDVTFADRTTELAMIAIQGPKALEWVQPHFETTLADLKYYTGIRTTLDGQEAYVTRTGYTGEDGCEVMASGEVVVKLWKSLIADKSDEGLIACGLGSRDTLRLEAAMPLYGHELDEETDPYTAGLGFGVKLQAGDFIGKEALAHFKERDDLQKRVGLILDGRRIAREGTPLFVGDQQIGEVTSGTQSPTLGQSIAMAYVAPNYATEGTELEVDFRGKRMSAKVVPLPFYRRS
jgi:aminomethyltransferase